MLEKNNIRNEILNMSCNCNIHKAEKLLAVLIKDDELLKSVKDVVFGMWYTMCEEFEDTEMKMINQEEKINRLEKENRNHTIKKEIE